MNQERYYASAINAAVRRANLTRRQNTDLKSCQIDNHVVKSCFPCCRKALKKSLDRGWDINPPVFFYEQICNEIIQNNNNWLTLKATQAVSSMGRSHSRTTTFSDFYVFNYDTLNHRHLIDMYNCRLCGGNY